MERTIWLSNDDQSSPNKREWRILEPTDPSDPVEHESFALRELNPKCAMIGGSIRGKSHAHKGKWREDFFSWGQAGPLTILTVADGAGSCEKSRVGSRLACETMVRAVRHGFEKSSPADLANIKRFMRKSLAVGAMKTVQALKKEAQKREIDEHMFSTTLLAVIHAQIGATHFIGSLQIGDGGISVRLSDGKVITLGKPDIGKYAGQSVFLPAAGAKDEILRRTVISETKRLACIALMTDGIADDFFPPEKGLPVFYNQMAEQVAKREEPLEALKAWIRYEKVGSYDDRTVIFLKLDG